MYDNTRPIIISDVDGKVVAHNKPAQRMLGTGTGKFCWDFVGQLKDDENKMPCVKGCVMELLAKGMDCSQQTQFSLRGKPNHLSCIPANGFVICMLGSEDSGSCVIGETLTPREKEILLLLAEGETTATAANLLGVNESTIRTHVERMRDKLSVSTRAAVVAKGFRLGYLD